MYFNYIIKIMIYMKKKPQNKQTIKCYLWCLMRAMKVAICAEFIYFCNARYSIFLFKYYPRLYTSLPENKKVLNAKFTNRISLESKNRNIKYMYCQILQFKSRTLERFWSLNLNIAFPKCHRNQIEHSNF